MCQEHHIGGLEDGIGRTDAYGHPVCSVMQVNRFTSPIDLDVEKRSFLVKGIDRSSTLACQSSLSGGQKTRGT